MDYSYVIDYLCQTAGPSIKDIGDHDSRVSKYNEALIAEAMRRYICGEEGDKGNLFFKVDPIGATYVFNGKFFEFLTETKFLGIVRAVLRKCGVGLVYLMDSAERVAKYVSQSLMQTPWCQFNPNRRYVCFENCVLDLQSGNAYAHDYKYCTDVILNFKYDSRAKSELWDRFMMQTVPDPGMRLALQQFCGAFFIDRTKHKFEYICFLLGEGQNGKSVLARALVNVLKNEDENGQPITNCITTFTPEQLFKSQQMDYHMAEVNGKIMNYCDDVSDKDFSGGDFKSFVSGGEFTGRSPYSKEMTKVTKVPIMMCCANKMPPSTDDTDGYYRRFLIINCPNRVAERDRDPQLEAKLRADEVRAAIFIWMYEGYKMLLNNGCKIEMSESVLEMKDDMKADSNSARRWIREYGLEAGTDSEDWKSLAEWMKEYKQYCDDYGEQRKTAKGVTKVFDDLEFPKARRSGGTWYCIKVGAQRRERRSVSVATAEEPALGFEEEPEDAFAKIPF